MTCDSTSAAVSVCAGRSIRGGWMSITLGVFDIFTYAVPGSLYLTLMVYLAARFGWVNPAQVMGANTTLVLIGTALACYLIGHVFYMVGRLLDHSTTVWKKRIEDARTEFLLRVPAAQGRPFVQADRGLLQSAIEVRQPDAAVEIIRLRAVGLMLRNSAPAFGIGSVVAAVEIVAADVVGFAAFCSALLLLAAIGSLWHARRLIYWADMKTLEVAFWIPGIDDEIRSPG